MAKKKKLSAVEATQIQAWEPFLEMRNEPLMKGMEAVYTNGEYYVEKWHCHPDHSADYRLAIKRADKKPIHSWSVLQRIKNEIMGPERIAIEVYPKESELVDTANIYHLWVMWELVEFPWKLYPPLDKADSP
jgi:hypothetical protein